MDPLCFLRSQSDWSQCYPFLWSQDQGSASYFFSCRKQWCLRQVSLMQMQDCSLARKILIPLPRAPGFLWWALSIPAPFLICSQGHALCLCFTESSVLQNQWCKGLGEGSKASCTEQRSNTLRSPTDVCLTSEAFQTSERRFHNIHMPVLALHVWKVRKKRLSYPIKWILSYHSPSAEQNMQDNWSLPSLLRTFLY